MKYSKKNRRISSAVSTVLETLEQRRLLAGSVGFELNPLTVPGIVSADPAGEQQQTDVDYKGGVGVTVWSDDAGGNSDDVVARIFDSDGAWTGAAFTVNTTTSGAQNQPRVAVADDGTFVVAWNDTSVPNNVIKARMFGSDGTPAGGEITVSSDVTSDHTNPALSMAGDGRFVVTWDSDGQDTGGLGIYGQRFTAAGSTAGSEFAINTTTTGDQTQSSVAMDDSANFVVSWTGDDSAGSGIFMQMYDNTGAADGSETLVNTTETGNQTQSDAVTNGSGAFVVSWTSPDAGGNGVFFQRFNAAGVAQLTETQANTTTTGEQSHSQTHMDSSGTYVVTYVDESTTPDRIVGRFYQANGTALTAEKELNADVLATQRPSVATISNGTFVISATTDNGTDNDVKTNIVSTLLHVTSDVAGSTIVVSENAGQLDVDLDGNVTTTTAFGDTLVVDGSAAADTITLNDGVDTLLNRITVNGAAGNDIITGSNQAEVINGGDGDDLIDANSGEDLIFGNDGNDTINSGNGADRVHPGLGDDVVDGGGDGDVLDYNERTEDMTIRLDGLDSGATATPEVDINTNFEHAVGGIGDDLIVGDATSNILGGDDGNDTITGGLGNDTVYGDAGTDTMSYADHTGAVTASLLTGTGGQTGESDNYDTVENLTGGTGSDSLTGDDNDNTISGGTGNDTLNGNLGADDFVGGDGTDIVTYASRSNALSLTLDATANDGETSENDNLEADIEGALGGAGNDTMVGDSNSNTFRGGAGDDSVDGASGNDSIYGDDGRDRLIGRNGNDYLEGDNGPDLMYGQAGNDFLFGGAGRDYFSGGDNNDRLKGGNHADRLYGDNGADTLYGDSGTDLLDGGAHDDIEYGGVHNDTIAGGTGADKLYGESGNDALNGGASGDRVDGGAGTDSAASDILDNMIFIESIV